MAFNKRTSFKIHNKQAAAFESDYSIQLRQIITTCNEPTLTHSDIDNIIDAFKKLDANRTNSIPIDQLSPLMIEASCNAVNGPDMRRFASDNGIVKEITPIDWVKIYSHDKKEAAKKDPGFRSNISRIDSKKVITTKNSNPDSLHPVTTFSVEETRAFSHWINTQLGSYLKAHGGLINEEDPYDLFKKMGDGIIPCKMLQKVGDNLIDDRAINSKISHPIHKHENCNLAINTAASIGCVITGQQSTFIIEGRPNMCLGLIWQVIRAGLFVKISLQENPYLANLLEEGETLDDLLKLSQEELLLRWVNYQLKNNDNYEGGPIKNFSGDIKDSVAYQYLMEEIQPQNTGLVASPTSHPDLSDRAEATLQMADRLDCRQFVTPRDIVKGHQKLNLAFVANLYNNHPNLKPIEDGEVIQETREEKTYRNWMNSMGIKPQINYLYTDLQNGVALLKLEDIVQPGLVQWRRVNMPPYRAFGGLMKRTENCAYAVDLAPQLGVKVIGARGHDICEGNKTLTLGIVWQLMRAYTLSLLTRLGDDAGNLTDKDIVNWFNEKTGMTINNFRDSKLADAVVFQKLLRSIDPEVEMEDIQPVSGHSDRLANANYVINCARKMGAVVYTLPEDIVESQPKMVLCFVITLMVLEKHMQAHD